jgi:hypothetical protein
VAALLQAAQSLKRSVLDSHLTENGKRALNEFYSLGCDPVFLHETFAAMLFSTATIPKRRPGVSDHRVRPRRVSLSPLDRLEDALHGSGKIDIRDLQRTAQRASKLLAEILKLKKTPLVAWLKDKGYIQPYDILGGSPIPETTACRFEGLLNLPGFAKQIGARKKPDFERRLTAIYRHIRQRTKGWHDREVAEILYDLFPSRAPNADSLLQWRHRRGLTD